MHPRTYHSHFLKAESRSQPEGDQGLRSDSDVVEQQNTSISPSSLTINPAVLQQTAAILGEDPQTESELFQRVMSGQRQHIQAHQQPGQSMPAPIRSLAAPEFPSTSFTSAEHPSRKSRSTSTVRGRRWNPTQMPPQMMSTWRHQDSRTNQVQRILPNHPPAQGVSRAIVSPRQDASKWTAAQTGDGAANHHLQRHRQLLRHVPPALPPQIPSIRSVFPEIHFTNQTNTSAVHPKPAVRP
jgi:hypothetical protein